MGLRLAKLFKFLVAGAGVTSGYNALRLEACDALRLETCNALRLDDCDALRLEACDAL